MKVIELKVVKYKDENWSYRKNLIDYLNNGGAAGMSFAEMRKSSKIIDQLEELEDGAELILEDEDYSHMMDRIKNHLRLGIVVKPLIQMMDDLEHAKSKSPERIAKEAIEKSKEVTSDTVIPATNTASDSVHDQSQGGHATV